jgi:hypothetical protein
MITTQTAGRARCRAQRVAVTAALALCTLAGTAGAATFATPFVSANNEQRVACQVTNIGATPVTAQVTLRDGFGQVLTPLFDNCNQPIDPQQHCSVFVAQFKQAYCSIDSSSSKVRGAIAVFAQNTDLLLVVPATK